MARKKARAPIKWTRQRALRRLVALGRWCDRYGMTITRFCHHLGPIPKDDDLYREANAEIDRRKWAKLETAK